MTTTQELLESSFELNLNNYGPEDVERLNDWAIKAYAALKTLQAENAQWRVDFKEMVIERDAALARLAELEKQEPVIYQAKTKPGFLSTSAYAWEDCEKADFLVYEADGVHVRGLYAAAGASLVATPIVAWAKSTPRKLRITTMDMGREDGWRPLGYTAAGASPVEPSESVEHRDELAKRKPEPAAETVGGLAKAVKAARGGDAPPAPMRRFA